jgi:hypothetical protein
MSTKDLARLALPLLFLGIAACDTSNSPRGGSSSIFGKGAGEPAIGATPPSGGGSSGGGIIGGGMPSVPGNNPGGQTPSNPPPSGQPAPGQLTGASWVVRNGNLGLGLLFEEDGTYEFVAFLLESGIYNVQYETGTYTAANGVISTNPQRSTCIADSSAEQFTYVIQNGQLIVGSGAERVVFTPDDSIDLNEQNTRLGCLQNGQFVPTVNGRPANSGSGGGSGSGSGSGGSSGAGGSFN